VRIAVIDKKKCRLEKCGFLCREVCPVVRSGKECIVEENNKAIIEENLCIGCGICAKKCPFGAINIVNLPEELKTKVLHQYGKNGFRIFKSVLPSKGKIIGILGQNGIGKTTMLSILAGEIKPNLGKEKASEEEIYEFFKGKEAQSYFRELYSGKVKVSFKPQRVELLPRYFSGKVKEFLEKFGTNDKIIEQIGIKNILDRDMDVLSGGELQKVALAASLMKDADSLFVDEPSSYLDIGERIKLSQILRSWINKERQMVVIEHDLIVLDFVSDLIHIFYGSPGIYGIVSSSYSTNVGINNFLRGFLKEENIRFREYEIKFGKFELRESKSTEELVRWTNLKKSFEKFSLEVNEGFLGKKEVVGILGKNGIGKTTFAKILAGLIKQDEGEISRNIKISYKPQYLFSSEIPSEAKVLEILGNIENYGDRQFQLSVIRPLQIEKMKDKKVGELSGGELQRIFIAYCLGMEADLYLLDEPSAYLDVEQRLAVAKAIREKIKDSEKSALVIDHDLLLIAYISDRIMLFEGIPSVIGSAKIYPSEEGMNKFLKMMDITMRRDIESGRPRINKKGSRKDREQREKGRYFEG